MQYRSTPILIILLIYLIYSPASAQVAKDLANSVPVWVEKDPGTNKTSLQWLDDPNATNYTIYEVLFGPFLSTTLLGEADGDTTAFDLGVIPPEETRDYYVLKGTSSGATGVGLVHCGWEIAPVLNRGRCLIAVTDTIHKALPTEIDRLQNDLQMDGWSVSVKVVADTAEVPDVKQFVVDWYDENYENSQTLFILGHVPVPYSGNTAYDGHTNHYGAWSADSYYAEIDGNWTDQFVNETSPSRDENDNIPGDGKFDQSTIPGKVEIEVGRVDFHNLPAFPDGEIELTRQYLEKDHVFRTGERQLPRRAIVENNFASFDEAFGQSAWRNFPSFFKGENVMQGNYDTQLDTSAYLCSYACGGGSYTSCGGIGTTNNLWVAKDIQTVFTMVFGSYFGDWDSQNNFLRSALASGDVLTNAWSGRPIWQLFHMGLGKHIGYSAKFTMNASSSIFESGYGGHSTHISLLGDPTLRLFYPKPIDDLQLSFNKGDIRISWTGSQTEDSSYVLYRKINEGEWEMLGERLVETQYTDVCIQPGNYQYMVKTLVLEETGSGSFYNTSLGLSADITVEDNQWLTMYFLDADEDGFGNPDIDTTACEQPAGYVMSSTDCDDNNPDINPDADDIPDNGIDENCDGEDTVNTQNLVANGGIKLYPNPTGGMINIESDLPGELSYNLINKLGVTIQSGILTNKLKIYELRAGMYWLEVTNRSTQSVVVKKIIKR